MYYCWCRWICFRRRFFKIIIFFSKKNSNNTCFDIPTKSNLGYSFFSRNYGMASDNLIEADVVIVNKNGTVSSVNATPGSELLWALKGAGVGNFGVVTRLRLRVFARPSMVSTVRINFESGATRAAFQLYDKIAPHAVDQLTLQFAFYKYYGSL